MKRKLMSIALAVMLISGCAATRVGTKNYCSHDWEPAPLWVILQSVASVQQNGPAATVSLMRCKKCHVLGSDFESAKPIPPATPPQPVQAPPPLQPVMPGGTVVIPASATPQ